MNNRNRSKCKSIRCKIKKNSFTQDLNYCIYLNYFSEIYISHWDENMHVLVCNARKIYKAENGGKGYY